MDLTLHNFLKNIILEGAESRNMGLAKHYLYDKKGMDEAQAMKTIGAIKTDIPNVRLVKCKFILGVTRLFCEGQLSDGTSISAINKYLRYIASDAHVKEYDQNLNGLSLSDIDSRFASVAKGDLEADKKNLESQEFDSSKNQYKIVNIDSFEDAEEYGKYTDWCVTHYDDMYDNYTHGGMGRFYFCLKNGFESVPMEVGEGCPLDEYGLSMIAVSVEADGSCNTITCRWNHEHGGGDHVMSPQELSNIIGMNFYKVFLPYSKEELKDKEKKLGDKIYTVYNDFVADDFSDMHMRDEELADLYNPEEDEYYDDDGYELEDSSNEYRDTLSNKDDVKDVSGDLDVIAYAGFDDDESLQDQDPIPSILIDTVSNGTIVDGLFDFQMNFGYRNGFISAPIINSDKYAIVDVKRRMYLTNDVFSSVYFIYVQKLRELLAIVNMNGKTNIIKYDGSYLFNDWVDGSMNVFGSNGLLSVTNNGTKRIINLDGDTLINNIALDSNGTFRPFVRSDFFFAKHTDGKIYAYSDINGNMIAPWCFSELLGFYNKQMKVPTKTGYNYSYLSFYKVALPNGERYLVDKNCNLCDPQSGEVVKANPYLKKDESKISLGSLLEESIFRFMLSEGSNIWGIYDKYYNGKIDKDDFKALNDTDPTSKGDNKGKYLPWLIKYYLKGEINLNSNISLLLSWYNSHKALLDGSYKDIMRMSPRDLMDCYMKNKDSVFNKEDISKQIEKVYEDDNWVIYIPFTYNASRYLVWDMLGGAEWCTAAQGSNGQYYFSHYTDDENYLYVNVRKSDNALFQYAPLTKDYMNKNDEPVTIEESEMTEGAIKWYNDHGISLDINTDEFPSGDDIYEGGAWGLKCVNDLYAYYRICDSEGNIIDGLPQVNSPSIRYVGDNCIITSSDSSNDGDSIFAVPSKQYYEWIDDNNNLYFESDFNEDNSKFMFVDDEDTVFIYNIAENKMDFNENCSEIRVEEKYIAIETDYAELYIFDRVNFNFIAKLNGDYFEYGLNNDIGYTSRKDDKYHVFDLNTMEDRIEDSE